MSDFRDVTADRIAVRNAASDPNDVVRKSEFDTAVAGLSPVGHTHANDHVKAVVGSSNSLALTVDPTTQAIGGEVRLATGSGLSIGGSGITVDFGTGATQVAAGNHTHANDHVAASAGANTNTASVAVAAGQIITASVRIKANGGITSDTNGIFADVGTTSTQVAAGNHTHAIATTSVAGFLSAADKTKLDGLVSGSTYTFTDTATIDFTNASGVITATIILAGGSGLLLGGGLHVDFTAVATAGHTHSDATTSVSGFLSATDKTKLDALAAATVYTFNDTASIDLTNASGTITAAIILGTNPGLLTASGLVVDFGTGTNQVPRGDHVHSNDHVAASAGANTNTASVTVAAGQIITASVRIKSSSGITSDTNGIFADVGTGSTQVAAGNHSHGLVTTSVPGFMSAADKIKLDGHATTVEVPISFSNTVGVNLTRASNNVTATLNLGTGLTLGVSNVQVDFTQVAAFTHVHANATGSVAGFLSASDKTRLDSLPDQTANDARYPRFSTGNPADEQAINSVVRITTLKIGTTFNTSMTIDGNGVLIINQDAKVNRHFYLPFVADGILKVDSTKEVFGAATTLDLPEDTNLYFTQARVLATVLTGFAAGSGAISSADSILTAFGKTATKSYVDSKIEGLNVKAAVRAATTANITLSGTQTIDGVAVIVGDRVLVKNQSTGSQNGVYLVASSSWTRTTDFDSDADITSADFVFVEEGTSNNNSGWVISTNEPFVLNTDPIVWEQFSGAGQITAGTGILKSGNTLSADSSVVQFLSGRNAASGYAGLDGSSRIAKAQGHSATVYNDQANAYTAGFKQSFQADATNAGTRWVGTTGDPSSLSAGDKWFRTDTKVFKYYDGTTTQTAVTLNGDIGNTGLAPQITGLRGDALPANSADMFIKRNTANNAWEAVTYGNSSNTVCLGNDKRLLNFFEPDMRIVASKLPNMGTNITPIADTAYFVYIGRVAADFTPKYVAVYQASAATGAASVGEVGLFSTPNAPNKGGQTLTKLVSTGTTDSFLSTTGVKRNSSAFATSIAKDTHLWVGFRINMSSTQGQFFGIGNDWGQGRILTTVTAGALTGAGPWSGALPSQSPAYPSAALGPDIRIELD